MVRFIKINSSRFLSTDSKFSLIKHHDYYQILMNSKIPTWSYKFSSVECAQNFLNSHDYVKATTTHMPMSSDDIEFIIDMYGFNNVGHNKWIKDVGNEQLTLMVHPDGDKLSIFEKTKGKFFSNKKHTFDEAIDVIDFLDKEDPAEVLSYTSIDEFKQSVTAAGKSARDVMKNMVRVKSSNLWSYCIEIKDRHDKTGTMYIQFKGKNGGPGDVYEYEDVLISDWRKMLSSPSKGHAFWKLIRNRYPYRKLTGNKRGVLRNAIN